MQTVLQQENQRLAPNLARNRLANPTIRGTRTQAIGLGAKGLPETRKPGCTVVMLIPARTNTRWWHDYCMKAAEIRFLNGRPKFGDAEHGLPQPLALIVFRSGARRPLLTSYSVTT